jgi:hypothetical protein
VFCVLYNILVNFNKQDPKENLDRKEPDKNNKIKKQIRKNSKEGIKGYNITDRKKTKAETKRDIITLVIWADYN